MYSRALVFDTTQKSYEALRSIVAERTQPLIAWTGSGLSAPAGLPAWGTLRDHLVLALENKAISLDGREATTLNALAAAARAEDNLWLAFELLQKGLGATSYRDEIRALLKPASTADVPDAYVLLSQLRLRGVLNLNLDRLATRAFGLRAGSPLLVERSGRDIARLHQVLSEPSHFVGNLHGTVEDVASWVFTKTQIDRLLATEAYKSFIRVALSTHTVIFLGITADDLAVGGHLESLNELSIETPTHFWLTNRSDAHTDSWAEQVGIRVIRYDSGDDHVGMLEALRDLVVATPLDEPPAPPVALERGLTTEVDLPSADEMQSWSPDEIRNALNAHATELLADHSKEGSDAYDVFRDAYDPVIYRAWYVNTKQGTNDLLGYTLEREVAKGSFGRVYKATSPEGEEVAIKVLLENIRNDSRMLHSFRRGVRSMRILSSRGVKGMVAYNEASEIPAFVVMEWVDGPNLAQAKASDFIRDWSTILNIARELSRVIRDAHALPERVLHRDIRPSNVMLKDYYTADGSVVVLDFDLSWHRDAHEVSVLHSSSAGYLAPEQLRPTPGASTRNAAVDSFGLGMTYLFLCTGTDPLPDEHRHVEWQQRVHDACDVIPSPEWKSIPNRFARLIQNATKDAQTARWDVAEIESELERLCLAAVKPRDVVDPDFLAEELAAHAECMSDYVWSEDELRAEKRMPTGLQYRIGADPQNETVTLSIEWTATGVEKRQGLDKYIAAGISTAADSLRAAGWRKIDANAEGAAARLDARIDAVVLRGRCVEVASRIDRAVEKLRFGSPQ